MDSASPMPGLTAVVFAAHPWNGIPYGLHHMSRALARLGWKVLYVEPYFSPLHLIGGRRRGRVLSSKPRPADETGVTVLSPFTPVPHLNFPVLRSPVTLRLAGILSWPRLSADYLNCTGFSKPSLVLCGSPLATDVALSLKARRSIYRLADDSSLFDVVTEAARRAEIDAISRFDGVIVTSSALEARASQFNARRVLLVSNGVDRIFFEQPAPVPRAMAQLPEPRILYAGAVENWFDWRLVAHTARERKDFSFVIVGRIGSPPPADLPANVHILHQQPYSSMPAFMQAATVGIIPFASNDHADAVRAINPLKLYEYLAAGTPVVSSVKPPNLDCDGLFVYANRDEFLGYLDKAVELSRSGAKVGTVDDLDWTLIVSSMMDRLCMSQE